MLESAFLPCTDIALRRAREAALALLPTAVVAAATGADFDGGLALRLAVSALSLILADPWIADLPPIDIDLRRSSAISRLLCLVAATCDMIYLPLDQNSIDLKIKSP
jgi:hypothetical protein